MPLIPLSDRRIPTTVEDALAPDRSGLLLWDLQYGLGGHAEGVAQLTACWRVLRDAARAAGVTVFRSRHISPPLDHLDDVELWRLMRKQGVATVTELRPFMQRSTHDADFLATLEPCDDEVVIEKTTPSIFVNTPAEARLRAAGVRTLVLAGVATDIGIEFTARHAMALGFLPVVVRDAVGSYTQHAQARGLACLEAFSFVTDTDTVARLWANC